MMEDVARETPPVEQAADTLTEQGQLMTRADRMELAKARLNPEKHAEVSVDEGQKQEKTEQVSTEEPQQSKAAKLLNEVARLQHENRKLKKEYEQTKKISETQAGLNPDDLRRLALEDPIEFAKKVGVDEKEFYNKYTSSILNGQPNETERTVSTLQKQMEEIRSRLQEREKTEVEQKQQNAVNNFKNEIKSHITENSEKYELLASTEQLDTVFEVIQQYYDKTGKILNIDEAADVVENELEKNLKSQLEKLRKAKKLQSLFGGGHPESQAVEPVEALKESPNAIATSQIVNQRKATRTLNHTLVGQTQPQTKARTREDRLRSAQSILNKLGV